MATIEQAAELLKPYRAELAGDKAGFFCGKLSSIGPSAVEFKVATAAIDEYLKQKESIHSDPETAIFFPGYFEQVVETTGPGPAMFRLFRRERTGYLLTSPNGPATIDLSPASESFLFHVGSTEGFRMFRRRITGFRFGFDRRQREREDGSVPDLREY